MSHKSRSKKQNSKKSVDTIVPTNETEKEILEELKAIHTEEHTIEEREKELLKKVDYELKRPEIERKKLYYEIAHFSYGDFSQIVIGCAVFSLTAFINTSFWDYLPRMQTGLLVGIHLFFIMCILLALNFEYRTNINRDFWFFKMLVKQLFYVYFSVFMVIILLLILVAKLTYDLTVIEVLRNFLAAQSVGMFGAVTFSFLKR